VKEVTNTLILAGADDMEWGEGNVREGGRMSL
jgi:hypothetical protein